MRPHLYIISSYLSITFHTSVCLHFHYVGLVLAKHSTMTHHQGGLSRVRKSAKSQVHYTITQYHNLIAIKAITITETHWHWSSEFLNDKFEPMSFYLRVKKSFAKHRNHTDIGMCVLNNEQFQINPTVVDIYHLDGFSEGRNNRYSYCHRAHIFYCLASYLRIAMMEALVLHLGCIGKWGKFAKKGRKMKFILTL